MGRSGTCRETLVEVRDGSGDLRGSLERVGVASRKSGIDRGTHGEVRDRSGTLEEDRDGSGDQRRGPGRVGEP